MSQENSYERDRLLDEFSKRLQQAVSESNFADVEQGVLSEKIGVSRQALRKWLEGKALPSQTRLPKIADLLNISLTWLATGKGEMRELKGQVNSPLGKLKRLEFSLSTEEAKLLANYRKLSEETQQSFSNLFNDLSTPPENNN